MKSRTEQLQDYINIITTGVPYMGGNGYSHLYLYSIVKTCWSMTLTRQSNIDDGFYRLKSDFEEIDSYDFGKNSKLIIDDNIALHVLKDEWETKDYQKNDEKHKMVVILMEYYGLLIKICGLEYICINSVEEKSYKYSGEYRDVNVKREKVKSNETFTGIIPFLRLIDVKEKLTSDFRLSRNLYGKDIRGTLDFTSKNINLKHFLQPMVSKGVFKPTEEFINNLLPKLNAKKLNKKAKDVLIELDVKLIQFTNKLNFNVFYYFNPPKDVQVKASKTVIMKWELLEYCQSAKVKQEVETANKKRQDELDAQKRRREYLRKKNTFTLMQDGKVIKENIYKDDLIAYLEQLSANMLEYEMIEQIRPIFDNFPQINEYFLCYWGTYRFDECSGERCDLSFNVSENEKTIDEETLEQIKLHYKDSLPRPTEKEIERTYGWTFNGQSALVFERVGDDIVLKCVGYDVEK